MAKGVRKTVTFKWTNLFGIEILVKRRLPSIDNVDPETPINPQDGSAGVKLSNQTNSRMVAQVAQQPEEKKKKKKGK